MAPTNPSRPESTSVEARSKVGARRVLVYVAVVLALGVVVLALIEGGERDLWSQPSAMHLSPLIAALAS